MESFSVISFTYGQGIKEFDFDKFIQDERINEVEVIISPFDDLKEAFDRLFVYSNNVVSLTSLGIIELIPLIKEVVFRRDKYLNLTFVAYDNFYMARKNILNQNPVIEQIDHIMSFMISKKFEQLKDSLFSALQVIYSSEQYYKLFKDEIGVSMSTFRDKIDHYVKINMINIKEDVDIGGIDD